MSIIIEGKKKQIGLALSGGRFRAAVFASSVKANLKRLNSAEMDVLPRHAGALLNHRLRNYTPELLS